MRRAKRSQRNSRPETLPSQSDVRLIHLFASRAAVGWLLSAPPRRSHSRDASCSLSLAPYRSLHIACSSSLAPTPPHPPHRYMTSKTELDPGAKRTMEGMWYRQARQELDRRLSAAEMLKDEGNDKFSEGEYADALEEYEYALQLFAYEMANLCRDQQVRCGDFGLHGLTGHTLPSTRCGTVLPHIPYHNAPCPSPLTPSYPSPHHLTTSPPHHLSPHHLSPLITPGGRAGRSQARARLRRPAEDPKSSRSMPPQQRSLSHQARQQGRPHKGARLLRRGPSGGSARGAACQSALSRGSGAFCTRKLPRGVDVFSPSTGDESFIARECSLPPTRPRPRRTALSPTAHRPLALGYPLHWGGMHSACTQREACSLEAQSSELMGCV